MSGFLQRSPAPVPPSLISEEVAQAFSHDDDEAATSDAFETGCVPVAIFHRSLFHNLTQSQLCNAETCEPLRPQTTSPNCRRGRSGGRGCVCVSHVHGLCGPGLQTRSGAPKCRRSKSGVRSYRTACHEKRVRILSINERRRGGGPPSTQASPPGERLTVRLPLVHQVRRRHAKPRGHARDHRVEHFRAGGRHDVRGILRTPALALGGAAQVRVATQVCVEYVR